jgi:hypothetical protein
MRMRSFTWQGEPVSREMFVWLSKQSWARWDAEEAVHPISGERDLEIAAITEIEVVASILACEVCNGHVSSMDWLSEGKCFDCLFDSWKDE